MTPTWEAGIMLIVGLGLSEQLWHDSLDEQLGFSLVLGCGQQVSIGRQHKGQDPNQLGLASAHSSMSVCPGSCGMMACMSSLVSVLCSIVHTRCAEGGNTKARTQTVFEPC